MSDASLTTKTSRRLPRSCRISEGANKAANSQALQNVRNKLDALLYQKGKYGTVPSTKFNSIVAKMATYRKTVSDYISNGLRLSQVFSKAIVATVESLGTSKRTSGRRGLMNQVKDVDAVVVVFKVRNQYDPVHVVYKVRIESPSVYLLAKRHQLRTNCSHLSTFHHGAAALFSHLIRISLRTSQSGKY